jgi:uncharacterized protein YkwD
MKRCRSLALALAVPLAALASAGSAEAATPKEPALGLGGSSPLIWRASTQSPDPLASKDPLYTICGKPEGALAAVATRNAARIVRGDTSFASDELAFTMRAGGVPYVWPRAWTMHGKDLTEEKIEAELGKFLAKAKTLGERRCGVARQKKRDGGIVVSLVTVDVLADLERVPTLVRVGEWITLKGQMKVPATDAKVVLLGPRGAPRTVLASLSGDEVRATFSADQPGEWLIQVLASAANGPRPVIEAVVHAGTPPALKYAETAAPGEDAAGKGATDVEGVRAMLNAARVAEGLKPLAVDAALDKVARAHSERMRDVRTVGHDVGGGDLGDRLHDAGLNLRSQGENVAGAGSLTRAHRALWQSPSHRTNILDNRFTRAGIGVARGEDDRVYVTQVFAD